ncbi:hypothetical protein UPYG_G00029130 [Umbra pygmaea]|uniref:C2H2-type domain-containing protein n=1 Tax=Umbra pygmaea TaxID=75934 RepID=A0ABD0XPS4_UMBPY
MVRQIRIKFHPSLITDLNLSNTAWSQLKSHQHLYKMDLVDQYGRCESSDQPEKDQSLRLSNIKEETEDCLIQQSQVSAVTSGLKISQVLPSPGKEKSEEHSFQPADEDEVAFISVKKEVNEYWLKSDDKDVEKVTVPWETSETSPSCSDTEESEMDGDHLRVFENHEGEMEEHSRTSSYPGMIPDTHDNGDSKRVSSFLCPHCTLGFTIERFFHGHLKRAHLQEYNSMLKSGRIIEKKLRKFTQKA